MPLPSNLTREQWIVYAAGFFDGEGCVTIGHRKNTRTYYLKVSAVQIDVEPLRILQGLFGGGIQLRRTAPPVWNAASQKAYGALREMLPYLVVKRRQAELAIQFQADIGRAVRNGVSDSQVLFREGIRQAISQLNRPR